MYNKQRWKEEKRLRESHRVMPHVQSARVSVCSLSGILVFPLCSPLSLSLSPVTPEIKCWRSQIATEE